MDTRVLSTSNYGTQVNLDGSSNVDYAPNFLPLGTVGTTATGELGVKAILIGSSVTASGTVSIAGTATVSVSGTPTVQGFVKEFQYSGTAAAGSPVFSTTAIAACTIPVGGRGFVQNEAAVGLLVKLGTAAATNSYSFNLSGASTAGNGTGGFVYINDYTGVVSCFPSANTSNFLAWAST